MYHADIVERLMREQQKTQSDLAEYLYGDRRRSAGHLLREGANPTAEFVERIAMFLGVSVDVLFGRRYLDYRDDRKLALLHRLVILEEEQIRLHAETIAMLRKQMEKDDYFAGPIIPETTEKDA